MNDWWKLWCYALGQKAFKDNKKNGKLYTGKTHKTGGRLMTGSKHTASSVYLTHTKPKAKK